MSLRIMVIPEDPTLDHYILQPVIKQACRQVGKPNAIVRVMQNPHASGVDHVTSSGVLDAIAQNNPLVDLFIFCLDRDGSPGRDAQTQSAVKRLRMCVRDGQHVDGRTAHQEVEVWGLAAHANRLSQPWSEVRSDGSVKESHFAQLVEDRGLANSAGGGREILGREAAKAYANLRSKCPEILEIEEIVREFSSA